VARVRAGARLRLRIVTVLVENETAGTDPIVTVLRKVPAGH
jgi:hypothetical protein